MKKKCIKKMSYVPCLMCCENGFTLIEILIVVAIISIFSTYLIVNFNVNEKERELKNNALLVSDGIKRSQTMALAGSQVSGVLADNYKFNISDCTSDCSYTLSADASTVDLVNLSSDIQVDVAGGSGAEISFSPPRGKTKILVDGLEQSNVIISIANSTGQICLRAGGLFGGVISRLVDCGVF